MAYIVDLRSDCVTKPTKSMKHAMVNSALGDDVFGEDPTVNMLESKVATLLGKQAALYVPSGTMSNLLAVMVHCKKRGSEAIVGNLSHIYKYEQGGAAHLAGVLLSTIQNKPDGTVDLCELEKKFRGDDIHEPITSLVAIENTHNSCGGKVLPLEWVDKLSEICKKHSIPLHMDGARMMNASIALKEPPSRLVQGCDSISICFSKGLSAPVGSCLVGSYHFIEQARRLRKMLGGGMRQAGVIAAAAVVALDEVMPLLEFDHKRAQILAKTIHGLQLKNFLVDVSGVHTNIVMVNISKDIPLQAEQLVQRLQQVSLDETQGDCKTSNDEGVIVKAVSFSDKIMRLCLHADITDEELWMAIMKITFVFKQLDAHYSTK
ncbi:probable low-specificity L-threonine aldolase 2 [Pieris napi]|uniref:probable low-specificity L-threonine aldolase 2 n=1 Tax=Pieris napi TaxID=78633 RepID=UPI001FBA1605|nr:probable low-specificity L-threonine aldolase 2 [Pieris napi]XP_047517444.1 probable low-specificity L-threonine aldolase 2 [Pieris napi]XP_047517445.1 probable low-specificity L-threonine aldolase 2 [Pieris napi]XP_047517446.1 probable low-specificity L-threonine aldolase 2 [Pieris napi]